MTATAELTPLPQPPATLRLAEDLPWVELVPGIEAQLLQVDLDNGLWIVKNRFAPGTVVQTHRHTGTVYAFTETGSWFYAEYPSEVNRCGSYLFEPAGSLHTLTVPADNTDVTVVSFVIHGANLNLAADGSIETVLDAKTMYEWYVALSVAAGHGVPPVIGGYLS